MNIKQNDLNSNRSFVEIEELPELEPAFMELGQQIIACGLLVAKQCDRYVHSKCSAYPQDKLFNIIQSSRSVKARYDG